MEFFNKIGNAFANFGSGNSLYGDQQQMNLLRNSANPEDMQKLQQFKRQGFQNLADVMGVIGAQGDPQRMALAQNKIRQRKIDEEDARAKAEQKEKQTGFMSIPKQVQRSSYNNNQEYYRAIGQKYIDEGYLDQGLKFLELGKPATPKDFTSTILSQRDKVEKQYSPVKDNVLNFQKLDTALNSDSGTGAYTALVFYLKNLDGSVVKSEEVNTFQEMQGFLKNIEQKYEKTKGEGMTDEVKAQLRNISAEATRLTVKGYNDYLTGSEATYNALGLDPNLIYSGYEIDTSSINLEQVVPAYFTKEITGTLE